MKTLTHDMLPERTRGFLNHGRLRVEGTGILFIAEYDLARFDDLLFKQLDIDFPESLSRAVIKRRAEYFAGRAIARVAQTELGVEGQVRIGADSSPIWPQGLSGSISHASSRCACLVIPQQGGTPGIDTEAIASGRELSAILLTAIDAQERTMVEGGNNLEIDATLCFSAKETLFKALYSTVRRHFGFDCACLTTLPKEGRVRLSLTETLHPNLREGRTFDIQYETDASHVLTWMVY